MNVSCIPSDVTLDGRPDWLAAWRTLSPSQHLLLEDFEAVKNCGWWNFCIYQCWMPSRWFEIIWKVSTCTGIRCRMSMINFLWRLWVLQCWASKRRTWRLLQSRSGRPSGWVSRNVRGEGSGIGTPSSTSGWSVLDFFEENRCGFSMFLIPKSLGFGWFWSSKCWQGQLWPVVLWLVLDSSGFGAHKLSENLGVARARQVCRVNAQRLGLGAALFARWLHFHVLSTSLCVNIQDILDCLE